MFNIGFTELIVLGIIGLLVIGPEQLPEIARKIARVLNDLKRAKDDIMSPMESFKNEAEEFVTRTRQTLNARVEQEEMSFGHKDPEESKEKLDESKPADKGKGHDQ